MYGRHCEHWVSHSCRLNLDVLTFERGLARHWFLWEASDVTFYISLPQFRHFMTHTTDLALRCCFGWHVEGTLASSMVLYSCDVKKIGEVTSMSSPGRKQNFILLISEFIFVQYKFLLLLFVRNCFQTWSLAAIHVVPFKILYYHWSLYKTKRH